MMEQFKQVARCRAHFAALGDGAEAVAAESHARRSLEMLVQTAARSCRSRTTARRATRAQGKSRETKRTKLTVLRRVQRRWERPAGVVGRRVEVVGRGEWSAASAGRSETGRRVGSRRKRGRAGVEESREVRKETGVEGCVRALQQCDREAGAPRGIVARSWW